MPNALYYGDNLAVLRERVADESVDLVYLDPPFNSNASYNVLFREKTGEESPAQIRAFTDTWEWTQETELTFEQDIIGNPCGASGGEGHDFRLPPVHRAQRDDGLPGDDGPAAGGVAARVEAHGQHLPALRPHGQPLPEAVDGCGVWGSQFSEMKLFGVEQARTIKIEDSEPIHDTLFFYTRSHDYNFNVTFRPAAKGHVESYFQKEY